MPLTVAINAADYGLLPSGADMTAAFVSAAKAARELGKSLFIEPGTYELGDAILSGSIAVQGVAGRVKFRLKPGASSILKILGAGTINLHGIDFDGQGRALSGGSSGALVEADKDVAAHVKLRIAACSFVNSTGSGLAISSGSGSVSQCSFSGCAQAAIVSLDAADLLVADNTIHDCGNNGILIWRNTRGHDGSIIRGNRISAIRADGGGSGQNGNGVNVFRADGVILEGNQIEDCEFSALRSNASSSIVMSGNVCRNLGEVAIYFEHTGGAEKKGAHAAVISGNVIENCANGITVTNFDNDGRLASVTGNVVRRCNIRQADRGVGIGCEADAVLSGNVIENAERYGIVLGTGSYTRNVSAVGNMVLNNDKTRIMQAGIGVSGAPDAGTQLLSANLVRMDASRGSAYGIVALDGAGKILMAGPFPQPVTEKSFPSVTLSGNAIGS